MKAIVTVGASASGKSTWARAHAKLHKNIQIVERDELRKKLFSMKRPPNEQFSWSGWNWKWEDEVTRMFWEQIEMFASLEYDLIVSDTNLHSGRRDGLIQKLEALGYEVETKNFEVSFFEAVKRDTGRPNAVGPWTIGQQTDRYFKEFGQGVAFNPDLPTVILVDIDGTVAKMVSRKPFDWMRVHEDEPHEHVWAMVSGLATAGYPPIFLSGRDSVCRDLTMDWLMDQGSRWIPSTPFDLFMRPEGDMRSDVIVKRELFDKHIRGKFNVKVVIDDRPKVAQMWRELGLEVVQVGNPYIDF